MKKITALILANIILFSCQNGLNKPPVPGVTGSPASSTPKDANSPVSIPSPTDSYPPVSFTSSAPIGEFDSRPCPPESMVDQYRDKVFAVKSTSPPCVKFYGRKLLDLLVSPTGEIFRLWQPFREGVGEYDGPPFPLYLTKYNNSGAGVRTLMITDGIFDSPAAAVNKNNELMVYWKEMGILNVRKFDSNLTPAKQKLEFSPSGDIAFNASAIINENGAYVIAYADYTRKVSLPDQPEPYNYLKLLPNNLVRAKFYNSSGELLKEIEFSGSDQVYVDTADDGSFIIASRERKRDSNIFINIQRFNNQAEPTGTPIRIDTGLDVEKDHYSLRYLTVKALKNGSIVAGWLDARDYSKYVLNFGLYNKDNIQLKSYQFGTTNYYYSENPPYSVNSYKNGDFIILLSVPPEGQLKSDTLLYRSFESNGEIKSQGFMINGIQEKPAGVIHTGIEKAVSRIDENDNLTVVWPEKDDLFINNDTDSQFKSYQSVDIFDNKIKMKKYDSSIKEVFSATLPEQPLP
jgi:hypothetical protein